MEVFLDDSWVSSGTERIYLTFDQVATILGVTERSVEDLTRHPAVLRCTRRDGGNFVGWSELGRYLFLEQVARQHERTMRQRERTQDGA